ncbi:hypothetical protein F5148DRAFT_1219720 [Russula earlei]|uniref:Uncharacterized protein n=1 Tax=Russula earlei TaxID=71964 RepID=A0ACC0U286_9AGAM|nr:hypothetical protein F5148DRAFT_1219720 [Russula earlei]
MSVIPSPSSGSARPRPSLPSSPHSSTPADGTSSSHSLVRKNSVHLQVESSQNQSRLGRRVTINMLPDGVLLDIFGCYVNDQNVRTSDWHTLLHVCQRWRYLTFASPLRLGLRLEYTGKKPMAAMLDVWPVLPIVITQSTWVGDHGMSCANNIVTALESEHSDHIHGIQLFDIPSSLLERVAAAMQKPFPELLDVLIWVTTSGAPVLSNSFLGGSAPNLRSLRLDRTPFPAMQKLLLSADELSDLGDN